MRRTLVTLALAVALALSGAPAYADSGTEVDPLACGAADSYSRYVDNVPYTFWLVAQEWAKDGTQHRYWHVERHTVEYGPAYDRSYTVDCAGEEIVSAQNLEIERWKWYLCLYDDYYPTGVPVRYVWKGQQNSLTTVGWRRFMYWRIDEWVGGRWVPTGDTVADCYP